ncbi:MAG: sulfite exporter TauE/SafE family protein [Bacteroidia bacterium]|nr:sulfite exporter TauE/SafE family protein [Bacteroidia bacterium]MCO5254750.1 sulfite exporter TauE/SafE family protein [Bacteroidota bacterium]
MEQLVYSLMLVVVSLFAGLVGALTGLGGGIIIVPALTLLFDVPIPYAIATSLIAVISTSSGAASAYVKEGYTNLQVGMFLQIATSLGAVLGAVVILWMNVPTDLLGIVFGLVLIVTAILTMQAKADHREAVVRGSLSEKLQLYGAFPVNGVQEKYGSANPILGSVVMSVAGFLSGLLGVGGGVFKVLAMDNVMRLPFKVSTTTSNFMIGVTAVSSAIIYLANGYVVPLLAAPVLIGIIIGSFLGAKILNKINVKLLKQIFAVIVVVIALYMIYNGLTGNFSSKHHA